MVVIEMFAFPVPKPIYLFIGMFRMLMLVCMGKLFAYLPILLDKFYFTQSSSANLCTYNDEYFENGMFYLMMCVIAFGLIFETIFQTVKGALVKQYSLERKHCTFMEYCMLKIFYAALIFQFGYYNYAFSFISTLITNFMIIPTKLSNVSKLLFGSIMLIPNIYIIKEIGLKYLWDLAKKSARAQACLHRYDMYVWLCDYIMLVVMLFIYFVVMLKK